MIPKHQLNILTGFNDEEPFKYTKFGKTLSVRNIVTLVGFLHALPKI